MTDERGRINSIESSEASGSDLRLQINRRPSSSSSPERHSQAYQVEVIQDYRPHYRPYNSERESSNDFQSFVYDAKADMEKGEHSYGAESSSHLSLITIHL